jgi:hypothetical protein
MLVYILDLPPPSDSLVAEFRNWERHCELSASSKQWLDDFHQNKINCAAHWFGLIPNLDVLVQTEYQQYFEPTICAGGGIMQNWATTNAAQPPHSDRARKLAINWYFDLGGNVDTVFYHEKSQTKNEAKNYQYQDVHELDRYQFSSNNWYAYDIDRCHAVEHIQTRRTFLSIVLIGAMDTFGLEELTKQSSIKLLTI